MLILASPQDKILVTTDAIAFVDVHASFVDWDGNFSIAPKRKNTPIHAVGVYTAIGSPSVNLRRNVKTLHIRNRDAISVTVTVTHDDGVTPVELESIVLLPGEELLYVEGVGFRHLDATGSAGGGGGTVDISGALNVYLNDTFI